MLTEIHEGSLRRLESVERAPDGVYDGTWSGNRLVFAAGGLTYEATTRKLIRGEALCVVVVEAGAVAVECFK